MLSVDALVGFIAVIETGSFTAAAERIGQTPSGVSRTVSRLEAQLGTALITRTTRRLDLTEEGKWLLVRAREILAELQHTEEQLRTRLAQPTGLVRVNAATPVLNYLVAPSMPEFLDRYPLVQLELISGETVIDLIEERADIAIRIGPLSDSTLNARRLGNSRLSLLASPAYLKRHGIPREVTDLLEHRLLGFTMPASLNTWPLAYHERDGLPVQPVIGASSGETLLHLAVAGAGVVCLADFMTRSEIASGRLLPILENDTLAWSQPVWAVFYKQGALAPRVSALVEFLVERLTGKLLDD